MAQEGMRNRMATTVVLAWSLTACDPISGVKTEADLTGPVDLDCIDRIIRSVPGVSPVERRTDRDESFQITPYRGKVVTVNDAWTYGGNRGGTVQISNDGKAITYFNGRLKMGQPLPKADLDAFVPMMDRVNTTLERECGLLLQSKARVSRN